MLLVGLTLGGPSLCEEFVLVLEVLNLGPTLGVFLIGAEVARWALDVLVDVWVFLEGRFVGLHAPVRLVGGELFD